MALSIVEFPMPVIRYLAGMGIGYFAYANLILRLEIS